MENLMSIKINRKILLGALNKTKPIVSGRHTLAILSSVLITASDDSIEITATDLTIGFRGVYDAEIVNPGCIVISHRELLSFVTSAKTSKEICITEKDKRWVGLSGDSVSANIACMNADDFPLLPNEINYEKPVKIDSYELKNMVSKAIVVKPQGYEQEKRVHITSALFKIMQESNYLRMASTHGGVLVQSDEDITINGGTIDVNPDGVLIPKDSLGRLNRSLFGDVKKPAQGVVWFAITDKYFVVQKENETAIITLSEGSFPSFNDIINDNGDNPYFVADRKTMLDAMKQLSTMRGQYYNVATFTLGNNLLKAVFTNPDKGEMRKEIPVQYEGEQIEELFRPHQFVDFLNLMKSDAINISIKPMSPCMLSGKQDEGSVFMIMPERR